MDSRRRLHALAAAVLAAVLAASRLGRGHRTAPPLPNHPWFAKASWLKPESHAADRAAILQAVSRRHPAKWQRSDASTWRAVTAPWTADELAARVPWLLAHAQMSSPEFVWTKNSSAPLLRRAFEHFSEPRVNASVAQIMRSRAPGSTIPYAYGSVTLGGEETPHWSPEMLREEVEPAAPLHLDDVPPLDTDDEQLGSLLGAVCSISHTRE